MAGDKKNTPEKEKMTPEQALERLEGIKTAIQEFKQSYEGKQTSLNIGGNWGQFLKKESKRGRTPTGLLADAEGFIDKVFGRLITTTHERHFNDLDKMVEAGNSLLTSLDDLFKKKLREFDDIAGSGNKGLATGRANAASHLATMTGVIRSIVKELTPIAEQFCGEKKKGV